MLIATGSGRHFVNGLGQDVHILVHAIAQVGQRPVVYALGCVFKVNSRITDGRRVIRVVGYHAGYTFFGDGRRDGIRRFRFWVQILSVFKILLHLRLQQQELIVVGVFLIGLVIPLRIVCPFTLVTDGQDSLERLLFVADSQQLRFADMAVRPILVFRRRRCAWVVVKLRRIMGRASSRREPPKGQILPWG